MLFVYAMLMPPVLAVVVTMFYWLWRVRTRRSRLRVVVVRAAEVAQ